MGSLCICIKEPALDNQMILTTASQSQYRNYTSPHIDDKPISQRYTNYNTISKSLTTQVFPFKKNFLENPIDEYPETARTKVSSVRNSNTYFKEDFSFTSNSKSISKDNQRLIVPIVDQNSKITTKIRVRNKEIRMICRKVGFLPLLLTLFRESFLYLCVSPLFFICFV